MVEMLLFRSQTMMFAMFERCQAIGMKFQNSLKTGISQKFDFVACALVRLFEKFKIMCASAMLGDC